MNKSSDFDNIAVEETPDNLETIEIQEISASEQDSSDSDHSIRPCSPPETKRKQKLKARVRSEDEPKEQTQPPLKKTKAATSTSASKNAWNTLQGLGNIRLWSYGPMYLKFKRMERLGKMDPIITTILHIVLMTMGEKLYMPGQKKETFLNCCWNRDIERSLSMIYLNAAQERRLRNWLKEYICHDEDPEPQPTTKEKVSLSYHSTLPTPPHLHSDTYTSSMIATGVKDRAVAGHFNNYGDDHSREEQPGPSGIYQPKTSAFLRSISWKDHEYRYCARSKGLDGDLYVKLEIFKASEVHGELPSDWWKHAEWRSFVPVRNKTALMATVMQLQMETKEYVEKQEDVSVEFTRLFYKKK